MNGLATKSDLLSVPSARLPTGIDQGKVEERFWAKVNKTKNCWLWTGHLTWDGYGGFWLGKTEVRAHRYAYELLVGPIPEGLTLDHLCRNRPCVHPLHLEPVTVQINTLRVNGLAAKEARRACCPRGHPYNLFNTYRTPSGHRVCRTCRNQANHAYRERKAAQL